MSPKKVNQIEYEELPEHIQLFVKLILPNKIKIEEEKRLENLQKLWMSFRQNKKQSIIKFVNDEVSVWKKKGDKVIYFSVRNNNKDFYDWNSLMDRIKNDYDIILEI